MFLGADGNYSSGMELMHYFYFEFVVYIVLLLILIINCAKTINYIKKQKDAKDTPEVSRGSILVSILCMVAFFSALFYQGIISDVVPMASEIWLSRVYAVCIIAVVVFVIQFYFTTKLK